MKLTYGKAFWISANPREIRTAIPRRKNSRLVAANVITTEELNVVSDTGRPLLLSGSLPRVKNSGKGGKRRKKGGRRTTFVCGSPLPTRFRTFMLSPRYLATESWLSEIGISRSSHLHSLLSLCYGWKIFAIFFALVDSRSKSALRILLPEMCLKLK